MSVSLVNVIFDGGEFFVKSDEWMCLGPKSVAVMLELLEAPTPVLSGAAMADFHPEAGAELVAGGLLAPDGYDTLVAFPANHDDVPIEAIWRPSTASFGAVGSSAEWIEVPRDRLTRHRIDSWAALSALISPLEIPSGCQITEVLRDFVWEIGEVRIAQRGRRIPMWFARRVSDPTVWRELQELARRRPHTAQRVILTSTPAEQLSEHSLEGHILVFLRDVLVSGRWAVDSQILAARLGGVPVEDRGRPFALSADGRSLFISGAAQIEFRSEKHIAVIRRLVEAHQQGRRCRATELLLLAQSEAGSLRRLFGKAKWATLSPYLNSQNGAWGFEL